MFFEVLGDVAMPMLMALIVNRVSDAKEFTNKLIESGNKCFLDIWENMMFMFQMADEFLHESHLALDRIGQIVTQNLAGLEEIKIENQPKLEHSLKSEA